MLHDALTRPMHDPAVQRAAGDLRQDVRHIPQDIQNFPRAAAQTLKAIPGQVSAWNYQSVPDKLRSVGRGAEGLIQNAIITHGAGAPNPPRTSMIEEPPIPSGGSSVSPFLSSGSWEPVENVATSHLGTMSPRVNTPPVDAPSIAGKVHRGAVSAVDVAPGTGINKMQTYTFHLPEGEYGPGGRFIAKRENFGTWQADRTSASRPWAEHLAHQVDQLMPPAPFGKAGNVGQRTLVPDTHLFSHVGDDIPSPPGHPNTMSIKAGDIFSIQRHVGDDAKTWDSMIKSQSMQTIFHPDFVRQNVLQHVGGDPDLHSGNFMYNPGAGSLHKIDNGMFGAVPLPIMEKATKRIGGQGFGSMLSHNGEVGYLDDDVTMNHFLKQSHAYAKEVQQHVTPEKLHDIFSKIKQTVSTDPAYTQMGNHAILQDIDSAHRNIQYNVQNLPEYIQHHIDTLKTPSAGTASQKYGSSAGLTSGGTPAQSGTPLNSSFVSSNWNPRAVKAPMSFDSGVGSQTMFTSFAPEDRVKGPQDAPQRTNSYDVPSKPRSEDTSPPMRKNQDVKEQPVP